jgi:hypothetical protein
MLHVVLFLIGTHSNDSSCFSSKCYIDRFLAARRGTSLFVIAGDSFGFATQGSNNEGDSAQFLAGHTQEWKIAISPTHMELEGSVFSLPGK